jgi:hypothetical protein
MLMTIHRRHTSYIMHCNGGLDYWILRGEEEKPGGCDEVTMIHETCSLILQNDELFKATAGL